MAVLAERAVPVLERVVNNLWPRDGRTTSGGRKDDAWQETRPWQGMRAEIGSEISRHALKISPVDTIPLWDKADYRLSGISPRTQVSLRLGTSVDVERGSAAPRHSVNVPRVRFPFAPFKYARLCARQRVLSSVALNIWKYQSNMM